MTALQCRCLRRRSASGGGACAPSGAAPAQYTPRRSNAPPRRTTARKRARSSRPRLPPDVAGGEPAGPQHHRRRAQKPLHEREDDHWVKPRRAPQARGQRGEGRDALYTRRRAHPARHELELGEGGGVRSEAAGAVQQQRRHDRGAVARGLVVAAAREGIGALDALARAHQRRVRLSDVFQRREHFLAAAGPLVGRPPAVVRGEGTPQVVEALQLHVQQQHLVPVQLGVRCDMGAHECMRLQYFRTLHDTGRPLRCCTELR
ncbi:hypothetical protein JKP88DRAFT_250094 [Tribonema minus]|uniref:Uncharacterized protein n=1 Tax=Tribonema minus TaxID=303371 RepID=A0A835YS53_9STRA|nr:hypothetical protein JKP88DRAFT_250094 [Tribonema minus]